MGRRRVPPSAIESTARIQSRGAASFARMPDSEVLPTSVPGGGPVGSVGSGPVNRAVQLFLAGFVVLFLGTAINHWAGVALGLALMVVGAAWGVRDQRRLRARLRRR